MKSPRIAVVICSTGRPQALRALVPSLAGQSRPADLVLFSLTGPQDIGFDPTPLFAKGTQAEVLTAPKGLPRQRNAALDRLAGAADLVVFYDDDFIASIHALAGIEAFFAAHPQINAATGHVLADGIRGPGIAAQEAARLVAAWDETHGPAPVAQHVRMVARGLAGLYGCNMAYRLAAVGETRFDEALPLYGWLEDIDFAARIPGEKVKTDAFVGVHCGTKAGRETAGRRLGYAQVVNPWYLWRKGTVPARFGLRLALRNIASNHAMMLKPEPWIDRAGRARGNWLGLWDIITRRAAPGRILEL